MDAASSWVSARELGHRGLAQPHGIASSYEGESVVLGLHFESVERIELPSILRDATKGKEVTRSHCILCGLTSYRGVLTSEPLQSFANFPAIVGIACCAITSLCMLFDIYVTFFLVCTFFSSISHFPTGQHDLADRSACVDHFVGNTFRLYRQDLGIASIL